MVGKIKKFGFVPRTLDDPIVKDGLEAVGLLDGKEPYYLVGGIATQSYLPSRCRRPTSDIDFAIAKPLQEYEEFRILVRPLLQYFGDKGYTFEMKKRSRAYCLDVTDSAGESLSIEFARRNRKNFENNRSRLEREFDNSNHKIVEERTSSYRVARVEDIVVPKLVRSIGSLVRNPFFSKYVSGAAESLSNERIGKILQKLGSMREEAMINPTDGELAETLRFISDIYDIRILSEVSGLNQAYMDLAESQWSVFGSDRTANERDLLINSVLPDFGNGRAQ